MHYALGGDLRNGGALITCLNSLWNQRYSVAEKEHSACSAVEVGINKRLKAVEDRLPPVGVW